MYTLARDKTENEPILKRNNSFLNNPKLALGTQANPIKGGLGKRSDYVKIRR